MARRDGVLALEGKLAAISDPFLKRSLGFLVDGVEASVAKALLERADQGPAGLSRAVAAAFTAGVGLQISNVNVPLAGSIVVCS